MVKKAAKKKKPVKTKKAEIEINCDENCFSRGKSSSKCGGIYGLGFIGSAIYFISTATSFWGGVFGFLKSIFWPASMVYEVLKFLGA